MTNVNFGVQLGPKKAEVHRGILPPIKPDQLLLKMEICNICTEDYQRWLGLRKFKTPMADGHEYVGIIVEKGKNVSADYQIGDRVGALNHHCGVCENCRRGLTSDCLMAGPIRGIGLEDYYGSKSFADYKIIDQRVAVKMSKDIPAEEAAFLEPLATVVQGIDKLGVKPIENIVVIGAGTMGLLNAQVAKAIGARVIVTELLPKKINKAKQLNVGEIIDASQVDPIEEVKRLTGGIGADAVIFAVGNTAAYKQGYQMLKKYKGRLLFFAAGYPEPEFDFDPNDLHYRKMEFIGTINADNIAFFKAAKMLNNRLVNPSSVLEGKTIPLRKFAEALEAAAIPGSYRVSIDLQDV